MNTKIIQTVPEGARPLPYFNSAKQADAKTDQAFKAVVEKAQTHVPGQAEASRSMVALFSRARSGEDDTSRTRVLLDRIGKHGDCMAAAVMTYGAGRFLARR